MKKIIGLFILLFSIQLVMAQTSLVSERFNYVRNSQLLTLTHSADQPLFVEKIGLHHNTVPTFKKKTVVFILEGGNPEMDMNPATRYKVDYEVKVYI